MLFPIFATFLALKSATQASIHERVSALPAQDAAAYTKVGQSQYLETAITQCDTQMVQFLLQSGEDCGTAQWKNVAFSLMKGSYDILKLVLTSPTTISSVDLSTSSNMILKGAAKKGYTDIVDLVFAHSSYDHQIHGQDKHVMQFFSMLDLDEHGQESFYIVKPIEWLVILAKNNDTVGLAHLLADKRWDPTVHAGVYSELTSLLAMNSNTKVIDLVNQLKQDRDTISHQ